MSKVRTALSDRIQMGGMLLAKAFLPTMGHLKQALAYLDVAVKLEMALAELTSALFWCSLIEVFMWFLALFLFISDAPEMVSIWLYMPHLLRAFFGLLIYRKLPQAHQLAANLSIDPEEKLPFELMIQRLADGAQHAVSDFSSQNKKYLMIYFGVTFICSILDSASFFYQIYSFSALRSADADIFLIMAATAYLILDAYYIMWVVSLQLKMPPMVSTGVFRLMLGFADHLYNQVGGHIQHGRTLHEYSTQAVNKEYDYISNQNTQ